jgi:preprotein translocase SecE subunit
MTGFLTKVKAEFAKVVWPTNDELRNSTLITLMVTVFFVLFVWGADTVISVFARWIYSI